MHCLEPDAIAPTPSDAIGTRQEHAHAPMLRRTLCTRAHELTDRPFECAPAEGARRIVLTKTDTEHLGCFFCVSMLPFCLLVCVSISHIEQVFAHALALIRFARSRDRYQSEMAKGVRVV